jgi:hypothetical protein
MLSANEAYDWSEIPNRKVETHNEVKADFFLNLKTKAGKN